MSQLKNLYYRYPELWNKLKDMEKDSHNTFKIGYTIEQLEKKFQREGENYSFDDYIEEVNRK